MKLTATNLADFLRGRCVTSALFTTFSLDEAVLVALAQEANLPVGQVRVLFDSTRFTGFERPRAYRRWLHPRSGGPMPESAMALPPVWHPKLAAVRFKDAPPLLILSSANLAPADQFHDGNVTLTLPIAEPDLKRLDAWARSRRPEPTVLAMAKRGGSRRLVLSRKSTWHYFKSARKEECGNNEEWLIASPFLSEGSLSLLHDRAKKLTLRLHAPTEQIAKKLCQNAPGFKRAKVLVPIDGGKFHQKVVAVRSRKGRQTRVVLYVGSANFTWRGFLGNSGRAGNTEAGALLIGGNELWNVALALATWGVPRWRAVSVQCQAKDDELSPVDLGEDEREETTARLEQLLASRLVIGRGTLRLRHARTKGPISLHKATLLVDSKKGQRLHAGRTVRVPPGAASITVQGDFRISRPIPSYWKGATRPSVQFEVPSLLQEVTPETFHPSANELRRLLGRPFDAEAASGRALSLGGDEDALGDDSPQRDVRFPWGEWARYRSVSNPEQRDAWLSQVMKSSRVPSFWKHVARALAGA